MKKTITIITIIAAFSFNYAYAGKGNPWIDIGLRANYSATNLLNSNLFAEKNLKYNFSTGYSYGGKIGFNFNEIVALNFEGIMTQFGQKYIGKSDLEPDWSNSINLKSFELPVLLKFTRNQWAYYEIGVKYGSLLNATDKGGYDIAENFTNSNYTAILGFGHALWGNGGLLISFGSRITYGLNDAISEIGQNANYPFLSTKFGPSDPDMSYKPTNTISFGFQLNIDFDLGQIATSSCGRKTKFVLFKH